MWIAIVIILLITFASLFMLIKITNENRRIINERKQAMEILREQYAKGEISDKEFKRKKKTLEDYS